MYDMFCVHVTLVDYYFEDYHHYYNGQSCLLRGYQRSINHWSNLIVPETLVVVDRIVSKLGHQQWGGYGYYTSNPY